MHEEENRKRGLAGRWRADALAPEVERNLALFGPVFRAPDRAFPRLRNAGTGALRPRREGGHESRPEADACSFEDGAPRKRMCGRQRTVGHGVLRFRRELAAPARSWAGFRTILSDRLGGRQMARAGMPIRGRRCLQRKLSPVPPRFASPCPPSARTVRGWRGKAGLEIGHCNDDMVGMRRFPEHRLTVDR